MLRKRDSPEVPPVQFSHIGLISHEKREGEVFLEPTRVWITDFLKHPYHIE